MVIEPIFEREFASSSYGFRPGRSCKEALREVKGLLRGGYLHVVDVDIKGYFDNIPHGKLMDLVRERIAEGKVLGLIEAFLKQGVLEDGIIIDPVAGSPQGGIISPLLANIYLNPLDWILKSLGLKSARYADDIVVLTRDADSAAAALERIREWMRGAELTLHPEKTRIEDMGREGASFEFQGYRFKRGRNGKRLKLVRDKSKQKLRATLRRPTKRSNGHSMETIVGKINPILRGWFNYFQHAHANEMTSMDGWVRMRLRSILRKRDGGSGKGWGRGHQRWRNSYFAKLKLFSLEQARKEAMSLRKGANH